MYGNEVSLGAPSHGRLEGAPSLSRKYVKASSHTQHIHTNPLKDYGGPVRTSAYLRLPAVTFASLLRHNFSLTLKATNALKPNLPRVRQAPARNRADISKVWQHQPANATAQHNTTQHQSKQISKHNKHITGGVPACGCYLHQSSKLQSKNKTEVREGCLADLLKMCSPPWLECSRMLLFSATNETLREVSWSVKSRLGSQLDWEC